MDEKFKAGDKVRLLPRNRLLEILEDDAKTYKRYQQLIDKWINNTKNDLDNLQKMIFVVNSSHYHQAFWECYWLSLEDNPDSIVCRYPAYWLCKVEEFKELEMKYTKEIKIESIEEGNDNA